MASSYSTDLKIELMVTGEKAGLWGDITNTNLNLVQQAIAGVEAISIAGGAQTTTLVMTDGALSNARNAVIKLTGAITGNQIVTVPNSIEKTYIVQNSTTGAFTVEFKTVSGTGVTFATTNKGFKIVYSDGTNIVEVELSSVNPIIEKILDTNGNEEIIFTATASAVNELTIANAATGNAPSIATTGGDTNIGLTIAPKGTGDVNIDADTLRVGDSNADATITTNGTGDLTISTNSGTNSGTVKIFDGVNGNIELTPNGTGVVKLDGISYPVADGSANQALVTNGSGVLSFAAVGASAGQVIQVVTATDTTARNTTSTSYVTASNTLSVSITPASASNKIFILCSVSVRGEDGVENYTTLFRGGSNILGASGFGYQYGSSNAAKTGVQGLSYLDSPSSTSSLTYQIYFKSSGGTITLNDFSGTASITAFEIKG